MTITRKQSSHTAPEPMLISSGLGKYIIPDYEKIPAGYYFSRIKYAVFHKGNYGKSSVEVFYSLRPYWVCRNIMNNRSVPDEWIGKALYTRIVHKSGTQDFDAFTDSMAEFLGIKRHTEFPLSRIHGVTEVISIVYDDNDNAKISKRFPFTEEDFIEDEDESDPEETDIDQTETDDALSSKDDA